MFPEDRPLISVPDDSDPSLQQETSTHYRSVRYRHSENFPEVLRHLGGTILISTYQAGKLVTVGLREGKIDVGLTNFEQAMGIAVRGDCIAVGSRGRFWMLRRAADIGPNLEPAGRFDDCFLARSCTVTGPIDGHEMGFLGSELWIANTLFSCLCTLSEEHSFVPRWIPPFVSQLAAEDRCHLNGLAVDDGKVRYVTALGETDTAQGWRPEKPSGGCLIDVESKEVVVRGLCMPHSPRVHDGKMWVLNSGRGELNTVNPAQGSVEPVASLPGYTRGLAIHRGLALVGLSKVRETATFGGVPIAEKCDDLVCGIGVVELKSGKAVASFQFLEGVDEIFDVQVLPGARNAAVIGPHASDEGGPTVWVVPRG